MNKSITLAKCRQHFAKCQECKLLTLSEAYNSPSNFKASLYRQWEAIANISGAKRFGILSRNTFIFTLAFDVPCGDWVFVTPERAMRYSPTLDKVVDYWDNPLDI